VTCVALRPADVIVTVAPGDPDGPDGDDGELPPPHAPSSAIAGTSNQPTRG
jgi:hypothetical protein